VQQEQEFDCDLIVIGKHGRSPLGDLLLGSTTRMVLLESSADVLVSVGREPPAVSERNPTG
jgi:nucleotide-binding universal stress UspA family protein